MNHSAPAAAMNAAAPSAASSLMTASGEYECAASIAEDHTMLSS
jgi:hypothetical protein